jgi:hypothetical protein
MFSSPLGVLLCTLFSSAVNLQPYFSSGSIIHVRVDLDNGDGGREDISELIFREGFK